MTAQPQPRLRSFLFVARKPDGSDRRDVLFYASSAAVATRYAEQWARKHGLRVTRVPDEAAA